MLTTEATREAIGLDRRRRRACSLRCVTLRLSTATTNSVDCRSVLFSGNFPLVS
jgi:hypothetical protein